MVYSMDRIPGAEDLSAQKRLATLIGYKLKREYSEMCGFVKARMSLAIVRSNSLLLCGPQDKEASICRRPELMDGVVMAMLAPWRGYIKRRHPGMTGKYEVKDLVTVMAIGRHIAREIYELSYIWEVGDSLRR